MPSNILSLEFESTESQAAVLKRLLPTVEYYRSKKKTLPDIYKALFKLGLVSLSFGSFKNAYYSQRAKNNVQLGDEDHLTVQVVDKSLPQKENGLIGEETISQLFDDSHSETALSEKVDDSSLTDTEMTLEEKRRISAQLFRQRLG